MTSNPVLAVLIDKRWCSWLPPQCIGALLPSAIATVQDPCFLTAYSEKDRVHGVPQVLPALWLSCARALSIVPGKHATVGVGRAVQGTLILDFFFFLARSRASPRLFLPGLACVPLATALALQMDMDARSRESTPALVRSQEHRLLRPRKHGWSAWRADAPSSQAWRKGRKAGGDIVCASPSPAPPRRNHLRPRHRSGCIWHVLAFAPSISPTRARSYVVRSRLKSPPRAARPRSRALRVVSGSRCAYIAHAFPVMTAMDLRRSFARPSCDLHQSHRPTLAFSPHLSRLDPPHPRPPAAPRRRVPQHYRALASCPRLVRLTSRHERPTTIWESAFPRTSCNARQAGWDTRQSRRAIAPTAGCCSTRMSAALQRCRYMGGYEPEAGGRGVRYQQEEGRTGKRRPSSLSAPSFRRFRRGRRGRGRWRGGAIGARIGAPAVAVPPLRPGVDDVFAIESRRDRRAAVPAAFAGCIEQWDATADDVYEHYQILPPHPRTTPRVQDRIGLLADMDVEHLCIDLLQFSRSSVSDEAPLSPLCHVYLAVAHQCILDKRRRFRACRTPSSRDARPSADASHCARKVHAGGEGGGRGRLGVMAHAEYVLFILLFTALPSLRRLGCLVAHASSSPLHPRPFAPSPAHHCLPGISPLHFTYGRRRAASLVASDPGGTLESGRLRYRVIFAASATPTPRAQCSSSSPRTAGGARAQRRSLATLQCRCGALSLLRGAAGGDCDGPPRPCKKQCTSALMRVSGGASRSSRRNEPTYSAGIYALVGFPALREHHRQRKGSTRETPPRTAWEAARARGNAAVRKWADAARVALAVLDAQELPEDEAAGYL
ncbi:hypothetical protein DFH09DRAFT_1366400 [Mycena vulgaris]|nr:hypothetical protein DFH09DRAFT_1366400 [Mycena vulgaris]